MSLDSRAGQSSFPSFEIWKGSLDRAWATRFSEDPAESLSRFERWYVPDGFAGRVRISDSLVYQLEKLLFKTAKVPALATEHGSLKLKAARNPKPSFPMTLARFAILDIPVFH